MRRRGMILLYVFLLMVVAMGLVAVYLDQSRTDALLVQDRLHEIQATLLAESGIALALQQLDMEPEFRGLLPDTTLGGGTIRTEIASLEDGRIRILSLGTHHGVRIEAEKMIGEDGD